VYAQIGRSFALTGNRAVIYSKKALNYEEQANQLIDRGLIAEQKKLVSVLKNISYYRLSGYWFPFRQYPSDTFKENTSLETILNRYYFDRHLRLLLLDGIERIEIAIRTDITYHLAHQSGAFGYREPVAFPKLPSDQFKTLQEEFQKEYSRSKETFASHFQTKYGESHDALPIWMVTELISFGTLFTMLRGIDHKSSKQIAQKYGLSEPVLISWMGSLNTIRNICAHHSRLWNRELGYKPMIPNKKNEWRYPIKISSNKVFVILCIIQYMLNFIAPQSAWKARFMDLLVRYPEIPIREMGMPDNWMEVPFLNTKHI
jgi:abortive infection bacteriophage resistance protein